MSSHPSSQPVGQVAVRRRFGSRPLTAEAQLSKRHGFRANQRFEPLPAPTGAQPYRLDLESVVGADAVSRIRAERRLVFHCAGDTGGVKSPQPQQIVAYWMDQDVARGGADAPAFFYHLGDVVYYHGERAEYYAQFYEPYAEYGAPIVAIPGNHDGDPLPGSPDPSLAAFTETFCSPQPRLTPEAQEVQRDAMTEPNVYWTLTAPFLTMIGLYTNVPEGGRLDEDQIAWLQRELAAAPAEGALLVAMHHPSFSADAHHGGSAYMRSVLDSAVEASGRQPHAVLAGHVHNYQRFTRTLGDLQVPYIVAGAAGYWHLHGMAKDANGQSLPKGWQTPEPGLVLESYVDDRHGYLRLTASPTTLNGQYVTVPRQHESWRRGPVAVADSFTIDLATHTVR